MSVKAVKNPTRVVNHTMAVSTEVKQYLERWVPSVYAANQNDLIGMWLINALTKKTKQVKCYVKEEDVERFGRMDAKKFGYMDAWHFSIPKRYQDCIVLPKRRVIQFNNLILRFMYAEMFQKMEILRMRGSFFYVQEVINEFRDEYKINDNDFSDERIRKAYQRFRQKNNTVHSEFSEFMPGMLLGKIYF